MKLRQPWPKYSARAVFGVLVMHIACPVHADECDRLNAELNQVDQQWMTKSGDLLLKGLASSNYAHYCEKARVDLEYRQKRLPLQRRVEAACGQRLTQKCASSCQQAHIPELRREVERSCAPPAPKAALPSPQPFDAASPQPKEPIEICRYTIDTGRSRFGDPTGDADKDANVLRYWTDGPPVVNCQGFRSELTLIRRIRDDWQQRSELARQRIARHEDEKRISETTNPFGGGQSETPNPFGAAANYPKGTPPSGVFHNDNNIIGHMSAKKCRELGYYPDSWISSKEDDKRPCLRTKRER